jgi:hypothetical protein
MKNGKTESDTESEGRRTTSKEDEMKMVRIVKGTKEETRPEIRRKKISKTRVKRNGFIYFRYKSIGCCIAE